MRPERISLVTRKSLVLFAAILLGLTLGSCSSGPPPTSVKPSTPTVKPKSRSAPSRTALPRNTQTGPPSTAAPSVTPTASANPATRPVKRISTGNSKVVYFTFDDGPSQYTPQILSILAKHNAHATFFELGEEIKAFPAYFQQVRAAGHAIGNHTYDHKDLTTLSNEDAKNEIRTGPQSRCLRPPYGAVNDQVKSLATDLNLRVVLWEIDPQDWARPGTDTIVNRVMSQVLPDTIVLLHDGGGDRSETVAALDEILTQLSAKGYTFQSLDC